MQIITQNEATAAERRIRFAMPSATDGDGLTGEAANITVKFREPGQESFVTGAGTVTEGDAGDAPGYYYYEATAGEVDTVGEGAIYPVHASGISFMYPFTIVPYDTLTAPPSTSEIADAVAAQATVAAALANMDAPVSGTSTFNPVTDSVTVGSPVTLADGAHGGASATITAAITGNVTGNLSGSVGSVTGAVGSVTGAVGSVTGDVGGNVTGSVGSVAGAVASVTAPVTLADGPHGGASTLITGTFVGSVSGSVGSVTGNVVGSVGSVTGAVGSVTGLTASDVAAIKAKTDSLTFTVAGEVDANVQSINGATVTGDGNATPWDGA
jgi:hypothetical protein